MNTVFVLLALTITSQYYDKYNGMNIQVIDAYSSQSECQNNGDTWKAMAFTTPRVTTHNEYKCVEVEKAAANNPSYTLVIDAVMPHKWDGSRPTDSASIRGISGSQECIDAGNTIAFTGRPNMPVEVQTNCLLKQ